MLDALVAAGADVDAPGSVIDGGGPLADAVAFGQWRAARRLVEHGARAGLWQAAGARPDASASRRSSPPTPSPTRSTNAFWCACHGGQREAAERLLAAGADIDWVGHDELTPLGAAERSEAAELADWLRAQARARQLRTLFLRPPCPTGERQLRLGKAARVGRAGIARSVLSSWGLTPLIQDSTPNPAARPAPSLPAQPQFAD